MNSGKYSLPLDISTYSNVRSARTVPIIVMGKTIFVTLLPWVKGEDAKQIRRAYAWVMLTTKTRELHMAVYSKTVMSHMEAAQSKIKDVRAEKTRHMVEDIASLICDTYGRGKELPGVEGKHTVLTIENEWAGSEGSQSGQVQECSKTTHGIQAEVGKKSKRNNGDNKVSSKHKRINRMGKQVGAGGR